MEVGTTSIPCVRDWIAALNKIPRPKPKRQFAGVSIVATYRNYRLCGYECWRHLEHSRRDPSRKKARLWFGRKKHGGAAKCLRVATKAALMMERMSRSELREWWAEYQAARVTNRPVSNLWRAERRYEDRLDFSDLQQLHHAYGRQK